MNRSHWSTQYNCLHQHRKHPLRPKAGNREAAGGCERGVQRRDTRWWKMQTGRCISMWCMRGTLTVSAVKWMCVCCFRLLCHVQKSATKLSGCEIWMCACVCVCSCICLVVCSRYIAFGVQKYLLLSPVHREQRDSDWWKGKFVSGRRLRRTQQSVKCVYG